VFLELNLPVVKDVAGARAAARVLSVSEQVANGAEMRRVGMGMLGMHLCWAQVLFSEVVLAVDVEAESGGCIWASHYSQQLWGVLVGHWARCV
jgi:hypothetical protein